MCICATEIKICTYACRVRASLALDARERTRRPCNNVFTSYSQRKPERNHLMYVNQTKSSMDMSANGPSAYYVQGKSQTISPHLTQSSTFLPGTCCKVLTAKPLQRNTQYQPPREIGDTVRLKTISSPAWKMEYLLVNMHTLKAKGLFARLMQKSMLRGYIVCSWHHW